MMGRKGRMGRNESDERPFTGKNLEERNNQKKSKKVVDTKPEVA